jgi:hypothetical protein
MADEIPGFPGFDPESVELLGGHRVGIIQPKADSLVAGELFVETTVDGVVRIWAGTTRPAGIEGNLVLVASSESAPPPPDGTDPPAASLITITAIPDPTTSPVTVSGTIVPGTSVDMGIAQSGGLVVGPMTVDASSGTFSVPFDVAPGVLYAAVVSQTNLQGHYGMSNQFTVNSSEVEADAKTSRRK